MVLTEFARFSPAQGTDSDVARVIVLATIRNAHTDPKLCGKATVQDCLDALYNGS